MPYKHDSRVIKVSEMLGPYKHQDEVGDEYDNLTIMTASFRLQMPDQKYRFHLCRCKCNRIALIKRNGLLRGNVRSCGCFFLERTMAEAHAASTYHGHSCKSNPFRDEWFTYKAMIDRCYTSKGDPSYLYTHVCFRWLHGEGDLDGFQCFLSDIGPKPGPEYSIDRIDSDGDYEPSNCQWLLLSENISKVRRRLHVPR